MLNLTTSASVGRPLTQAFVDEVVQNTCIGGVCLVIEGATAFGNMVSQYWVSQQACGAVSQPRCCLLHKNNNDNK